MTLNATLLPYQPPAVELMVDRHNALVAYDCGLGKTVCAIAACEELMEEGVIDRPVLVVCLSSLKFQWAKEIAKFSDSTALVINGTKSQRAAQYISAHLYYIEDGPDYIVISYEALIHDWDEVQALPIGAIVADEATAIKSFKAKRAKRLKALSKSIPVRFALTGTPMENGKPEEVWSIMQFVDPAIFGRNFRAFDSEYVVRNYFGGVSRYKNLPHMRKRLEPAFIRKSQNDPDVAPFLPEQIHRDPILVPMSRAVRTAYRKIAAELKDDLDELARNGATMSLFGDEMGAIMPKITALRMLVQHPHLVLASADDAAAGEGGNNYLNDLFATEPSLRNGLESSKTHAKLDETIKYLLDHLSTDDDAKAVVFTTFVGMVDLLAAALMHRGIEVVTYTGRMNSEEKEVAKVAFQTDPSIRVLVSSDAGGYGVDLPQANLLVNYDLPWSSGTAVQRNARIRRASSRWPSITIQDFLVEGSIEERIHEMLQAKSAVASAVVDGGTTTRDGGIALNPGSLRKFLR